MAVEANLFGLRAKRSPYFAKPGSSSYSRVVNALWQEHSSFDRKAFLEFAQKRWTEVYRENPDEREALYKRTGEMEEEEPKCLMASAVQLIHVTDPEHTTRAEQCSAGASCSPRTTVSPSEKYTPRSAMGDLFDRLCVEPDTFFSPEVEGKVTLVAELEECAKRYVVFDGENALYERSSSFQWSNSMLKSALATVDHNLNALKETAQNIVALRIDQRLLLTNAGSITLNRKLRLLTEFSAHVLLTRKALDDAILRLQMRNAQIRQRNVQTRRAKIHLRCELFPSVTWEDAVGKLKEAGDGQADISLGTPLNLKQLQRCADALQSASALPLSALISLLNEQPHSADIQTTSASYLGALVEQLLFHLPVLSIFDLSARFGFW